MSMSCYEEVTEGCHNHIPYTTDLENYRDKINAQSFHLLLIYIYKVKKCEGWNTCSRTLCPNTPGFC